jgi:transcriptional regulator with XRE-family HTH domain
MESRQQAEVRFGQRLKDLREDRDWSQEELARRLTAAGVPTQASTIGKLEWESRAPRAVRLAEIMALADIFEVSIDWLLQRGVKPRSDQIHALIAAGDTAVQSLTQITDIIGAIEGRMDDLALFKDDLPEALTAGYERARDLLIDVDGVLADVRRLALNSMREELRAK